MNVWRFLSLVPLATSVPVIVPAGRDGRWNDVPSGYRYCPAVGDEFSYRRSMSSPVNLYFAQSPEHTGHEGYLCHVAVYESTCDFRWYGVKYRNQRISRRIPTDSECVSRLGQLKEGRSDWVGFPSFSCNYAAVTTGKRSEIILIPHHVGVDDYKGFFVDPTLRDGLCVKSPCKTVYEDTLWLPSEDLDKGGPCDLKFSETKGSINYPPITRGLTLSDLQLVSPLFPTMNLGESCWMQVCGKMGIRTRSGVWVGIKEEPSIAQMKLYETFIHPCPPNLTISAGHFNPGALKMAWDAGRLLGYSLCQKTWDKLERGDQITPLDLSYLNPSSPGPGLGFMSINGTLKMAKIRFKRMELDGGTINNYDRDNANANVFQWQRWVPHGNVLLGPNGITLNGSTVKFPFYMIGMGRLDSDLIESELIDMVNHVEIKHTHILTPIHDRYGWRPSGEAGDLVRDVRNFFHIPDWIRYVLISVVAVIGLTVVGTVVLKVVRKPRTPQNPESPSHIPLNSMSSFS
nr:glycoprotein [Mediterranean bat virus]